MIRRRNTTAVGEEPVGGAPPRRSGKAQRVAASPLTAFLLLVTARLISAGLNIIHDCDETFNYLEPLHYLLYGSGMQTWEYSAQFALRSYLYLLLHAAVMAPAMLLGAGRGKLLAFCLLKAALGLASAITEMWLYRAVARRYRPAVAHCLLVFLCISSGMFAASTSMLPSTFTMYAMTAAAAAMMEGKPYLVIAAAAVGVIWGWCVAGFAFLPYALYVLVAAPILKAVGMLILCLLGTLGPLVLVDRHYYGTWTASLWNFIKYNVVGGGDSALYGVEGPTFYLRNGFNNFQLILPLALALPLLAALVVITGDSLSLSVGSRTGSKGSARHNKGGSSMASTLRLLTCASPVFVWLAAITALPHKEERFLYVVYPLICLAASASFVTLCDLGSRLLKSLLPQRLAAAAVRSAAAVILAGTCLLAVSRSAALVINYGAPLQLYKQLPEVVGPGEPIHVCTGAEWHRFPSAFFLPGSRYRLQFIKSGFNGLLPRQFNESEGGTQAAPVQFNDRNREEPANYWTSAGACQYAVTLRESGKPIDRLLDEDEWQTVASLPFVENARSPVLSRAFFIPMVSSKRNRYVEYVLLKRQ